MTTPKILIYEQNLFHRRLMTDLVECNDMHAVPVDGKDWIDRLEKGADKASVVVLDLDRSKKDGIDVLKRLRALPKAKRPRIVGVMNRLDPQAASGEPAFGIEEIVQAPIDTGTFARAVARQVLEARAAEG